MPGPVSYVKSVLVGRPKETSQLEHERLSKKVGLAVFASDNLSSSAYATEEMMIVLIAAGSVALSHSLWITAAIVGVLALIAFSYRETIHAYPSGGGAYIVAHENLGRYPGLVAASALLIDYILTVAVSISAGIAAVISAAPNLEPLHVGMAVGVIAVVTTLNLRGVRESGTLFAIPTYAFIVLMLSMLGWGFIRYLGFGYRPSLDAPVAGTEAVTLLLLMRAFSHGSTAVTGIEAISNGVQAFRKPEARNAAVTLAAMASILGTLFVGITVLALLFHINGASHDPERTLVARLAQTVFGEGHLLFFGVQAATALILFLAANTSYADFPRLSAVLAKDRYAPRQLLNRGDRLAYSNGIIALAVLASVLVVVYDADVSRLINLYVVGVFASLTLSQLGMVRHWRGLSAEEPRWRAHLAVNAVGASATFVVFLIVLVTKFLEGAWMVVVAAPIFVAWLNTVNRHYGQVATALRDEGRRPPPARENHVVLLVGEPSREEALAFTYADRIRTDDFRCVHFAERGERKGVEARWVRQIGLLPTAPALEIVRGEGAVRKQLRAYVQRLRERIPPEDFITVVISEVIRGNLLDLIRSRGAILLKASILYAPGVAVTDVPYIPGRDRAELQPARQVRHVVMVLVSGAHNATLHALDYAKVLDHDELHAVHIAIDPDERGKIEREWRDADPGLPLEVVDSPYRDLAGPLLAYLRTFTADGRTLVTLILPEFLVKKWWHNVLHNQNALAIKRVLLLEPDIVVTSVPYRL